MIESFILGGVVIKNEAYLIVGLKKTVESFFNDSLMNFPVKSDKLDGIVRSYADIGYPRIELKPSSSEPTNKVTNILRYNDSSSHWVSGYREKLNAKLVIKIVDFRLNITHYSIRSHPSNSHFIQAWTFEGSNDNHNYEMIDNRTKNADLANSQIGQYEVNNLSKSYRYFRIMQTMLPLSGENGMRISGLDLFGLVIPLPKICTKKCIRSNRDCFLLFIMSSAISS